MKGVSAKSRKNLNQMLKRVQHDNRVRVSFFCHPEPGPEASSGSKDFGISVLGFKGLGFKAPPCGRGSLLQHLFRDPEILDPELDSGHGSG